MNEMDDVLLLLESHKEFNNDQISKVNMLYENKSFIKIACDHSEHLNREVDCGFNLFNIISDTYYRENFHSYILKALLDPFEKHREGDLFLIRFIEFINKLGAKINKNEYTNTYVYRELGRIDIQIKDEISKKAIIIENKIYDAVDMPRQIPRYYAQLIDNGYEVDAVIYLVLYRYHKPDMKDWTDEERKLINDRLIVVRAYAEKENDLLNGWLRKCEKDVSNIDALFVLRQYGKLIQEIGGNIMNMPIMEEFYNKMLEGENFKTATSLQSMLVDLPYFRIEKLIEKYKYAPAPFASMSRWTGHNVAVFEGLLYGDNRLAIDIIAHSDKYAFQFFLRVPDPKANDSESLVQDLLFKSGLNEGFHSTGNRMEKIFVFPAQENEIYDFIDKFLLKLSGLISMD